MSVVYVSSKKNIMFYFYLVKNFLEGSDEVCLRACGAPVATALIVAEMLRDGEFVRRLECRTSTMVRGDSRKTQVDVTVYRGGETERAGDEGDRVVYVAQGNPPAYWVALVDRFLATGACTVSACGKCIPLAVVTHEVLRCRRGTHVHPIRTRTVVCRGTDRSWKKTEIRFDVQLV